MINYEIIRWRNSFRTPKNPQHIYNTRSTNSWVFLPERLIRKHSRGVVSFVIGGRKKFVLRFFFLYLIFSYLFFLVICLTFSCILALYTWQFKQTPRWAKFGVSLSKLCDCEASREGARHLGTLSLSWRANKREINIALDQG